MPNSRTVWKHGSRFYILKSEPVLPVTQTSAWIRARRPPPVWVITHEGKRIDSFLHLKNALKCVERQAVALLLKKDKAA